MNFFFKDVFKTQLPHSFRLLVQSLFCAIIIHIGIKFYRFVWVLETGAIPGVDRPPGVEAFLPISALVSLKHFILTGTINSVHPSALVLFLIICLTALIVKKGFCAWVCPIGLFSDVLSKLHIHIFKKSLLIPTWLDLILQSLKYLIAGFFIWSIFYSMPASSIEQFIQSPYNRFADIKMLKFFTQISNTSLIVIIVLSLLSIVIPYFWCRYLCPYGAILGVFSFLSFGKIHRNASNCTECGQCEKKCPGLIKIRLKHQINSSECTACMECIQTCPEKNAIGFSLFAGKLSINQTAIALILILLFTTGISMAKISGNWQNKISKTQYLNYVMKDRMPWPQKRQIDPEKMERMLQMMSKMKSQGPG